MSYKIEQKCTDIDIADEHKILAELACSTMLVPAYSPDLFAKLVTPSASGAPQTVVFVVCGGFKTSLVEFEEYRAIVDEAKKDRTHWNVLCNGEQWKVAA